MQVNTTRLRLMIGWLGMLLPWIIVLLIGEFPRSISATYYTNASTAFMIILGAASFLLMCYKGYSLIDDYIFIFTGFNGLLVCLFPCSMGPMPEYIGTFLVDQKVSDIIHGVSSVIFFGLLAFSSIFLFTKSGTEVTANKKKRNIIYYICGIGMIASFAIKLLPSFPAQTWLMETIALFFFGLSFLTKADYYSWLFCDPKE